ncbi:MAG: alpha-2-macroglobulin, partial [Candidatus Tectomicrobia bacterium]
MTGLRKFWLSCGLHLGLWVVLLGLAGAPTSVDAQAASLNLQPPSGAVIVPDKFLRRWDPVTLFYDRDTGPEQGGPEDHADRYVSLTPSHPGAFTWLNARTLQFRPAEPWPPLTRFTWQVGPRRAELSTLMSAPVASIPKHNARHLHAVETITLTFPEALDPAALQQMVSIELRALPGLGSGHSRWLGTDAFDIKSIERRQRSDQATYVLMLHNPFASGIT